MLWLGAARGWGQRPALLLLAAPGVGFGIVAGRQYLAAWRLRKLWKATGIPPVAGVTGLDHPDVQHVLSSSVLGATGLRCSLRTLRRRLAEIDQAPAHLSGGRVRIR